MLVQVSGLKERTERAGGVNQIDNATVVCRGVHNGHVLARSQKDDARQREGSGDVGIFCVELLLHLK